MELKGLNVIHVKQCEAKSGMEHERRPPFVDDDEVVAKDGKRARDIGKSGCLRKKTDLVLGFNIISRLSCLEARASGR